jgi:hypothetical protein
VCRWQVKVAALKCLRTKRGCLHGVHRRNPCNQVLTLPNRLPLPQRASTSTSGSIGRVKFSQFAHLGPFALPGEAFAALVTANHGLPRPGRDLDCRVLTVTETMPLLVLAATYHGVVYYALCNLAEQAAVPALKWVQKLGRLELTFTVADAKPSWSAMHLDEQQQQQQRLGLQLRGRKHERGADDSWRDKLGLLLLSLPQMLAEVDPTAASCTHHCAVLLSGNRATHDNGVERCLARVPRL